MGGESGALGGILFCLAAVHPVATIIYTLKIRVKKADLETR